MNASLAMIGSVQCDLALSPAQLVGHKKCTLKNLVISPHLKNINHGLLIEPIAHLYPRGPAGTIAWGSVRLLHQSYSLI